MHITFLHTAQTHIDTFDPLLNEIDHQIGRTHLVDESLLAEAQRDGETAVLQARLEKTLTKALAQNKGLLVCTCSTIGKMAEAIAPERVMRIDRPMMVEAIRIGGRIQILATVESTVTPTVALLKSVAGDETVDIKVTVIAEAWPFFERGDIAGYHRVIGEALVKIAQDADVIVLAQASMAGAIRMADISVPALSSPEIGAREAVRRARSLVGN